METDLSEKCFLDKLRTHQTPEDLKKIQGYFKSGAGEYGEGDTFMGVRMGTVFEMAKAFIEMPTDQIELLLENPIHEARTGAVSIMDFVARNKKSSPARKEAMFALYIRRHDRINNWDLVDRAAPHVVGGYLADKPRDLLYSLARSQNMWERRTAIVSTWYFIRQNDVADTFRIAEILMNDSEDLIHKATGGWLREAGKKNPEKLIDFLDIHGAEMSRTTLRYAIEHLDEKTRMHYMRLKKSVHSNQL
jgi:hypothetical protein